MDQHKVISVTPVISTTLYAAGDAVGGKLQFAGAANDGYNAGRVVGVTIVDLADQKAALKLVLFSEDFTPSADNAAFDPSDADLAKCVGVIPIAAADYTGFVDNAAAHVQVDVGFELPVGATILYGQLVTSGTPTYVSASDLQVKLHVDRDAGR